MEKNRELSTSQQVWYRGGTIDSTLAGADVALAKTERFYSTASLLGNVVVVDLDPTANGTETRFLLDSDADDVDIDVWAVRTSDDNLILVCTLDLIAGDQDSDDSLKFADTGNISNEDGWPKKPVWKVSGADYIGRLLFDGCGYDKLVFHGYGTFDSDCVVEVAGY
jgi:hypothetical protein